MRSTKSKLHFFLKMKKKPAQQEVLDNISDYTVEELENLRGTQFPKWVRQALVELKGRDGKSPEEMAAMIAAQMTKASLKEE